MLVYRKGYRWKSILSQPRYRMSKFLPHGCFGNRQEANKMAEKDGLAVVWTSGDKEVAENMVFMYTINAKKRGWWEDITFIIWGPSSNLLSEDEDLQEKIEEMDELGITLKACKACAERYGVSEDLEDLGIEVKYMGEPLTEHLKKDKKVITF